MVNINNIMEHLENSPEEKKVCQDLLEYFFPIWMSEKNKESFVKNLPDEDMEFLSQVIIVESIPKIDINNCKKDNNFLKVKKKLIRVKDGEDNLLLEIKDTYRNNFDKIINQYTLRIEKYKYNNLSKDKKAQVDSLIASGKKDVAERIIGDYYKKHNNNYEKLVNEFNLLKAKREIVDLGVFSSKALKLNPDLIEKVACIVCNPVVIFNKAIEDILNGHKSLPCDWYLYRELTLDEYKTFFDSVNDSEAWHNMFIHTIENIKKKMDIPILPIKKRKHLLDDILHNISEERYDSSLIIMFSVIEGLLWEIVKEVNKEKKVAVDKNKYYDCKKGEIFETTRIRDVIERTYVSEELDGNFLKYFCNELYEERNPVLHGGQICKECPNEGICIIEKTFTIDYLLTRLYDIFKIHLFKLWDEGISSDRVKYYLDLFYNRN